MAAHASLETLLQHPALWRVGDLPVGQRSAIRSGFEPLDAALPCGGWEEGALTEILVNEQGIGELSLLMPALRATTEQGRGVVIAAPPFLPFPHAWEARGVQLRHVLIVRAEGQDLLWTLEQAARSGGCGLVIGWTATCRRELNYQGLRRLHSAAQAGGCALILYRPAEAAIEASAAPTRIVATACQGELHLHLVKRRAALMAGQVRLTLHPPHWSRLSQDSHPVAVDARVRVVAP
jgi:cell division inhibitor SulA/protein ImuA